MIASVLMSKSDGAADGSAASRHTLAPKPRVLVVEDHEDTRFMLRTLLEMRGLEVVEAADGEIALDVAERTHPDLILMDTNLPRLDGLGAMRRLREFDHLRRVPVVFLSGHAAPAARAVALAAGGNEYLIKPLDFKQLFGVLEKYLSSQKI